LSSERLNDDSVCRKRVGLGLRFAVYATIDNMSFYVDHVK